MPGALALEAEYAAADVRLAEESKDVPLGLVVAEAVLPDDYSAPVGSAADDSVAADCWAALKVDDRSAPAAPPDDCSAPVDSAVDDSVAADCSVALKADDRSAPAVRPDDCSAPVDSAAADCSERAESVAGDLHPAARSAQPDSLAGSQDSFQVAQWSPWRAFQEALA